MNPREFQESFHAASAQVHRVMVGLDRVVDGVLAALFADGNVLLEGLPGLGKTRLVTSLAQALDLVASRIQFTPDLMPADITGTHLVVEDERGGKHFSLHKGPVFANVILADEINRATPKTQSALLEAMAEEQVTVEGVSRHLPLPFMVIATQNPAEHHGTYPLPESQLDRFMLRLHMGYPSFEDERRILRDRETINPLEFVEAILTQRDILELQQLVTRVRVDDALVDYLLRIVDATRQTDGVELGISPRGALALFRSAQALALIEGRDYCIADDIHDLAVPVLAHRVRLGRDRSPRGVLQPLPLAAADWGRWQAGDLCQQAC